jgi:hypothetical protein
MTRILTLHLKTQYFQDIKSGSKLEEFRLCTSYWEKRLSKSYDEIHLKLGYPKRDDAERTIIKAWRGCKRQFITHEHFGSEPVEVFAIDVK